MLRKAILLHIITFLGIYSYIVIQLYIVTEACRGHYLWDLGEYIVYLKLSAEVGGIIYMASGFIDRKESSAIISFSQVSNTEDTECLALLQRYKPAGVCQKLWEASLKHPKNWEFPNKWPQSNWSNLSNLFHMIRTISIYELFPLQSTFTIRIAQVLAQQPRFMKGTRKKKCQV